MADASSLAGILGRFPQRLTEASECMSHSILIVEDDAEVRHLIRHTLASSGYDVSEASNGAEAVRTIKATPFDLVITDILMPEQDGLETIIFLRRNAPNTKIIAISGTQNELFLRDARGLGAGATLTKPFQPAALLDAVHRQLQPVGVG
jgi:CheY-like chemotaxis protein